MSENDHVGTPLGAIAAIVIAGLLVPARDWLGSTNVALVLVVVVAVVAAIGGRLAGAATAVTAALAFNFFHTDPYYSLRINDRIDIITAVLLLVVGLVVGELASLRMRSRRAETHALHAATHLEATAAAVAAGLELDPVWRIVRSGLVSVLGLAEARFEPGASGTERLPRIERDGRIGGTEHVFARDGFALPREGAEILVGAPSSPVGRVIVTPAPGSGVSRSDRRAAVALADQLGVVAQRSHALRPLS